jgi:hypothetical protein
MPNHEKLKLGISPISRKIGTFSGKHILNSESWKPEADV